MKLLYILLFALFISCSTEPEDCAGVGGGTAEEDMCGVCDNDTTNDYALWKTDGTEEGTSKFFDQDL